MLIQTLSKYNLLADDFFHRGNAEHNNPNSVNSDPRTSFVYRLLLYKLIKTTKPTTIDAPDVIGVNSIQTNPYQHRLANFINNGLPNYQEVNYAI